jgi:hypothetical protein
MLTSFTKGCLRIHPIPRCWTFRESVPTNSYHARNQLPLITADSRNRLQFRPIPRCINSRNSVRFRNRMIIVRFPYSTTGTCIQFWNGIPGIGSDSGIPGIVSRRNYAELYGISTDCGILVRNWIITWCRSHDRIILEIAIPESDGIPRNSHRFRFQPIPEFCLIPEFLFDSIPEFPELMELIPRAELIPQCSTWRNRMTARTSVYVFFGQRDKWDFTGQFEKFREGHSGSGQ